MQKWQRQEGFGVDMVDVTNVYVSSLGVELLDHEIGADAKVMGKYL